MLCSQDTLSENIHSIEQQRAFVYHDAKSHGLTIRDDTPGEESRERERILPGDSPRWSQDSRITVDKGRREKTSLPRYYHENKDSLSAVSKYDGFLVVRTVIQHVTTEDLVALKDETFFLVEHGAI